MKRWAILSIAAGLTGCGTYLPQLTSHETLPLEVLIAKIDCEFQIAVWTQKQIPSRSFLKGWQGQYSITLKSNEIGSAKALTNTFPFLPAKNLAVNANLGGGETTTANRTALMKFNLAFDDVTKPPVCAQVPTSTLHPFITGRIGFEEWMNRAFEAAEVGGNLQLQRPQRISSLGHTFEFSIDVNANAGAGFVIAPAPTIGINPAVTIDRLDDGVIDVVVAKPAVDPLPEVITALTKEEKELVAELKKLIEKKQQDVDKRDAQLNAPANKELLAKVPNFGSMNIESILPSDERQQKQFQLTEEQLGKVRGLKSLLEANQSDGQTIEKYQKRLSDIKPTPRVVTSTRVLPPDRNPEIATTAQQLTLER